MAEKLMDGNPNIKKYIPSQDIFYKVKNSISNSSAFDMGGYGCVILHPDSKKADIHINSYITDVRKSSLTSTFGYLTFGNIVSDIGITKFDAAARDFASSVIPYGVQDGLGVISDFTGNSGLLVDFASSNNNTFSIGRTYNGSSGFMMEGGWPMNYNNLIVIGRGYKIDIYNISYV